MRLITSQAPLPAIALDSPSAAEPARQLLPPTRRPRPVQKTPVQDSFIKDRSAPHENPTKESGGVPEPTADYTSLSLQTPTTLSTPRHILVVVDLNGTLLYRPDVRKDPQGFVARPHARRFLEYCVDTFCVLVWSSAVRHNVDTMCDLLLPHKRPALAGVWGRDTFGLSATDYRRRVQCYKRLSLVWADDHVRACHPDAARGGHWDQTNTVLVDDSVEKARSEPCSLILVPEYLGDDSPDLHILPQVHDYLNTLSCQSNVSGYINLHPFQLYPAYVLEPGPGQRMDRSRLHSPVH